MYRVQVINFVKYLCFSKEFRPKFLALREYSNVSLILIFLTVTLYILARYWIHILPTATLYVLARYSSQKYSSRFALKFKFKFDLKNNGLSRFMFQRGIQTKQPSRVSRESLSLSSILFFFPNATVYVLSCPSPRVQHRFYHHVQTFQCYPLGEGQVFRSLNLVLRFLVILASFWEVPGRPGGFQKS